MDMTREAPVQRLLATFLKELDDHLRGMSRGLVTLQQSSSQIVQAELTSSLLRSMHSLKGAARSVRVELLELVCHLLEDLLLRLKPLDPRDELRADLVGLLLSATDAIDDAGKRLENGVALDESPLAKLLPRLQSALESGTVPNADTEPDRPWIPEPQPVADPEGSPASDGVSPPLDLETSTVSGLADREDRSSAERPMLELFRELSRSSKELASAVGKSVELTLSGGSSEIRKELFEELRDPLRQLVRNAVDHGIESPAERLAAGKPRQGQIDLRVTMGDTLLEVVVEDDGRGIDLPLIAAEAKRMGLAVPSSEEDLARLAFEPGLSTSPIVTQRFGRGIGLDVVRSSVESLGGSVGLRSEPGRGTHFLLTIPLSRQTVRAMVVTAAGQAFALPGLTRDQVRTGGPTQIRRVLGQRVSILGGEFVPVARLASILGLRPADDDPTTDDGTTMSPMLMIRGRNAAVLAEVDEVIGEQTLQVRKLRRRLRAMPSLSGGARLGTGKLVLVLNPEVIVERSLHHHKDAAVRKPAPPARQVLLLTDSEACRSQIEPVLQAAGFVITAVGSSSQALQTLSDSHVDILIAAAELAPSDWQPLVREIRGSERFAELPIVIVAPFEGPDFSRQSLPPGVSALVRKADCSAARFTETLQRLLHRGQSSRGDTP